MLNFNHYFAMQLTNHDEAVKQRVIVYRTISRWRSDMWLFGVIGGTQMDRHAQWLIYYKPNYSNSPVQVEISSNFRRLSVCLVSSL